MARGVVGSRKRSRRSPEQPPVGSSRLASPPWPRLQTLHPVRSLILTVATVAIAVVADLEGSRATWIQIGLGMLLFQFSFGIMSEVADAADGHNSKAGKPATSGGFRRDRAVLLAAVCAGGGLLVTITFPLAAWLAGVAGLACGLVYVLVFRRTVLSWLPFAVAVSLIPIWVYAALELWNGLLWWTLPIGILLGFSLYIASRLPRLGQKSRQASRLASERVDARRIYGIAIAAFGLAASAAIAVLLFESPERAGLIAADAIVIAFLGPRATRLFGRDGLVGVIAAATAVMGVVFISAV
ncbi:MAG: hypothetical protein LC118_09715 [Dehalococcoidia bacterium]|nr:hypothetical protein [Dehalococcoidia bacterium]